MKSLLKFIFPSFCEVCQQETKFGQVVCSECESHFVPLKEEYCLTCSEKLRGNTMMDRRCIHCRDQTFHFEYVVTAYEMNPYLRHFIHTFKYMKGLYLSNFLVKCLSGVFYEPRLLEMAKEDWVLTSVPIHHIRERGRGFDQAKLLATKLSKLQGIPFQTTLERVYPTQQQTGLRKKQREGNLKHAIKVIESEELPNNVFLVDDVYTTGTTVNECAKVLKSAGVERVIVLCLARR